MKNTPKTAFPNTWNSILESSRHKAGDKVFEKIRRQKNLTSVLKSSYHNFSNQISPCVEKEDLSPQLSVLKNSLDMHRSHFVSNEKKTLDLELEKNRVSEICQSTKEKLNDLEERAKKLRESVQGAKEKQGVDLAMRNSLFHVFDRMRTTIVFLKEKKRVLWENLHLQDFSLETNKKKSIKVKDSLQITHQAFELFQSSIENDKMEKDIELKEIKANLEALQKITREKEEHITQEKLMSEQILINDQSNALETLRKQFFSHFLWYMVSSQHFEKEKIKYKVYEDAYARIKLATGISDVPQFVDKFLSQEVRYYEFVNAVKDKEAQMQSIKNNIGKMQKMIDDIKDENKLALDNESSASAPNAYRLTQKKLIDSLVKYKRLRVIKKKVQEWVKLNIPKLSENYQATESDSLLSLMTDLKSLVITKMHSYAREVKGVKEKNQEIKVDTLKP